jgi:hypothetical protein
MKLCEDCRWCRYDQRTPQYSMCDHPETRRRGNLDYVTGQQGEPRAQLCYFARDDPRLCGPDGRYWEEKSNG